MDKPPTEPLKSDSPDQGEEKLDKVSAVDDAHQLKIAQNLITVASICGPVSLFLGSLLASAAGVICSAIGLRRLNKLINKHSGVERVAIRLRIFCIVALVLSCVTLIINAVIFYLVVPIALEAVSSGDFSILGQNINPSLSAGPSGGNSTWG